MSAPIERAHLGGFNILIWSQIQTYKIYFYIVGLYSFLLLSTNLLFQLILAWNMVPPSLGSLSPKLLYKIIKELPINNACELLVSCRYIYDNSKSAFNQKYYRVLLLILEIFIGIFRDYNIIYDRIIKIIQQSNRRSRERGIGYQIARPCYQYYRVYFLLYY